MKLAIIRTIGHVLDINEYNCQELGLAKALLKKNISSDVYVVGNNVKPETFEIEYDGSNAVKLICMPYISLLGYQCYIPKLLNYLSNGEYDLIQVHEYHFLMSYLSGRCAIKSWIPLVLCQGMYKPYDGFFPSMMQKCYNSCFLNRIRKSTHAVIAKTNYAAGYMKGLNFNNIHVAPIGLDDSIFINKSKKYSRKSLNIPENATLLLYVGILEERRGIYFLLELFENICDDRTDVYFLIVGSSRNSKYQERFENNLRAKSDLNRVRYIPGIPQDEISSIYEIADLFLLHSDYEIYGMVILEAMFFGLPILTTLTAGSDQLVIDGKTGFILPPNDLDNWKAKLLELIDNPEYLEDISVKAESNIKNNYTWSKAVDRFYEVYMQVLNGGS